MLGKVETLLVAVVLIALGVKSFLWEQSAGAIHGLLDETATPSH